MTNKAYGTSGYARIKDDNYQTVDPRCVYGFLEHFKPPKGTICVDVCSPDGSGIVDTLHECGYPAFGIGDAFADKVPGHWVVTNPPYKRPLVDKIITRQIERVRAREVELLAVLVRSTFDLAKSRELMFAAPLYKMQIRLRFRPWWTESRKAQPFHHYVWHIWTRTKRRPLPFHGCYSFGHKPAGIAGTRSSL